MCHIVTHSVSNWIHGGGFWSARSVKPLLSRFEYSPFTQQESACRELETWPDWGAILSFVDEANVDEAKP